MKKNLAVAVLAAIVGSISFAQYQAPTKGLTKNVIVTTDKRDADNCPLITVQNTGDKPFRLTIRYTHSGTTIGNAPSSETATFTHGNFEKKESRDFEIHPGGNCRKPNRLIINEIKAELY